MAELRPSHPTTAPSVRLLRALGDLQRENDDMPLDDLDVIAAAVGLYGVALVVLIGAGIRAGFIEAGREGELMLSAKGQRWYTRDLSRR